MSRHSAYWSRLSPIISGDDNAALNAQRKADEQAVKERLASLGPKSDVFFGYALFTPPKPPSFFSSNSLDDVANWYGAVTMFPDCERAGYYKDGELVEEFKGKVWAGTIEVTASPGTATAAAKRGNGVKIGLIAAGTGLLGLILGGRKKRH